VNTTEPIPWRGFRAIEKLIIVALGLLALAVLLLPFLDNIFLRRVARLTGSQELAAWLAGGGTWILGAAVLLVLALFVLWRRSRLVGNRALWYSSGCPECGERELVRVTRHFSDRFYSLVGVPAYRFACRNCTWRGLRIGRREQSPERDAEREAALLRFDPDSRPAAQADDATTDDASPPRPTSVFRDTGDVHWAESSDATLADDDYADDLEEATANHESDEPLEEMEWLWPRPSGTDQV
jgi:hypothetical protein